MRKILTFLFILFLAINGWSQSVGGRYASRMTQDGTIYFIMPIKLKETVGIKNFEYDMTLLSWSDSVTVNFTFESKSMLIPTNLTIESSSYNFECTNFKPLFIDIKKNRYEIRITSAFAISNIDSIISCPSPPSFTFRQGDESKSATYKTSQWEKDKKRLTDILSLYNYIK